MSEGTETALVIGVTSDIGRAIAHEPADGGCVLQLAGRDPMLPMGALAERRDSGVLAGVSSVASERAGRCAGMWKEAKREFRTQLGQHREEEFGRVRSSSPMKHR